MGQEKRLLPPTSSPRGTHAGATNGGLGEQRCPESRPTAVLLPQGTSHPPGNPQINQKPSGFGEQNDGDRQGKHIPTTLEVSVPEHGCPTWNRAGLSLPLSHWAMHAIRWEVWVCIASQPILLVGVGYWQKAGLGLLFCQDGGAIPTCPVGDKACPTLLVSQPAHLISPTLVLWLCLYLYQGWYFIPNTL